MSVPLVGVLLAGGQGRRLSRGDKALVKVGGIPMIARAARILASQTKTLIVNANGDPGRFDFLKLEVVPDSVREENGAGPLAGIHAALAWTFDREGEDARVVTAAADAPFLPADLVDRLNVAMDEETADVSVACSGERTHPVCACWRVSLAHRIEVALQEGVRKIDRFTAELAVQAVHWPIESHDPFFNVNTPEDLVCAEKIARGKNFS